MYAFYLFALFASILRITVCADWCYASQYSCDHKCNEPNQWTEVSETCDGKSQSPINIVTRKVTVNSTLTPLGFQGYQEAFHSTITNNGHTVKIGLSGNAKISGGDLKATYKAMELHFHWGKDGGPGSEHTIDGEQYPMEMHIVHVKETYSSVQNAVKDSDGVAVLGFLYEEAESSSKRYDSIIGVLGNITHPGNSSEVGPLSLNLLIPSQNELKNYFRYKGSLTTPDCSESVIWTVFQNTILLSKSQLSAFSELQFENGNSMVRTFRPVQPLNDRLVFYSSSHVASASVINHVITTRGVHWSATVTDSKVPVGFVLRAAPALSPRRPSVEHGALEGQSGSGHGWASVGIGAAVAKALVQHGMKVVGCARSVDKIEKLAAECVSSGFSGTLIPYKCDLTVEEEILSMFSSIKSIHRGVDVCINNAGLGHAEPLLSGKTSAWRNMFDVNILALSICTREAYQSMKERNVDDGHIIQLNSIAGHLVVHSAEGHFYTATKHAVTALTEGLRQELRDVKSHIRATCISPGVVETEFGYRFCKSNPEKAAEMYGMMKCLQSEDVADAVIYVLSAPPHVQIGDIQMRPVEQDF
ncbi:hypothetical protein MHYP_G00195470 [Metynnis hypsauchen]